jgi:hypothetical protein
VILNWPPMPRLIGRGRISQRKEDRLQEKFIIGGIVRDIFPITDDRTAESFAYRSHKSEKQISFVWAAAKKEIEA